MAIVGRCRLGKIMFRLTILLITMVVVAGAGDTCWAQRRHAHYRGMAMHGVACEAHKPAANPLASFLLKERELLLRLASQKPVQEDMKLSADQTSQLDTLMQSTKSSLASSKLLRGPQRQNAVQQTTATAMSSVESILSAEQYQRLTQIALQKVGYLALADPTVAQTLELTPEQQMTVVAIETRMRGKLPSAASGSANGQAAGGDQSVAQSAHGAARDQVARNARQALQGPRQARRRRQDVRRPL